MFTHQNIKLIKLYERQILKRAPNYFLKMDSLKNCHLILSQGLTCCFLEANHLWLKDDKLRTIRECKWFCLIYKTTQAVLKKLHK